jgi:two-component system response regulator HydG
MTNVAKCILVVDDVRDWQATLSGMLTDEGYTVEAVGDRKSALETLEAGKFDMAVIDIRLDESDEANIGGLGLAREIKRVLPDLPVIIITGYPSLDTVQQALQPDEQGKTLAIDFVLKANVEELVDIVSRKLGPSPS